MSAYPLTLPYNGHNFSAVVTTYHTGSLVNLLDLLDELPAAARRLVVDGIPEETLEGWACLKILLRTAVPLAAHGYLDYEPFAALAGTATAWPDDLGGNGERPTRAEAIGYGWAIRRFFIRVATQKRKAPSMELQADLIPFLHDYYLALAKRPEIFGHGPLQKLMQFPAVAHEELLLDYLDNMVFERSHLSLAASLEFCVTALQLCFPAAVFTCPSVPKITARVPPALNKISTWARTQVQRRLKGSKGK